MVAPLKLKREKIAPRRVSTREIAVNNPVARVLVKTPVSHLEDIYDYLVPESLTETAIVGSLVKIEYGHTKTEGLVIERSNAKVKNLKILEDVLGWPAMVTPEVIEHLRKVQLRFGGTLWSLLDSYLPAIPSKFSRSDLSPLTPNSESDHQFFKNLLQPVVLSELSTNQGIKYSVNQPPGFKPYEILIELIRLRARLSQVLIIVSDFREFDYLFSLLKLRFGDNFQSYDTRKGKRERFEDFEKINKYLPRVILGNRSASFLPLLPKSSVFIVNDCDSSHYEHRSPGWNSRDVSLLRSKDTSLFFFSATPSYEIQRLVEIGWIKKLEISTKTKINYFVSNGIDSFLTVIKNGLKQGNVLVSVAAKGYANIFLCSKCRSAANCNCGGKLKVKVANTHPICYLCGEEYKNWRCRECGSDKPFVISKGLDRTAEEIARAIPSAQVIKSTSENPSPELQSKGQVFVSSRGAEPITNYSAVILLDGEKLFNQPHLRSEEILKHSWFDLMSRIINGGAIYISLLNNHPLTQQLLLKQSASISSLRDRKEAKLPPYYRICKVVGKLTPLSAFAENIKKSGGYILSNLTPIGTDSYKLIIRVAVNKAPELVEIMQDIVRMQGVKGKPIFEYRFDPYDL